MPQPVIHTLSNRTATVLLDKGASYALRQSMPWALSRPGGKPVSLGVATTALLFLDGLEPATDYIFSAGGAETSFTTLPCRGMIDAADYGVSADQTDNRRGFARAIAAVPKGGTLHLREGIYMTGPVFLKPDMTLLLDAGATLAAIGARADWPQLPAHDAVGRVMGTWEGLPENSYAAVVTAIACDGLTITGRGTIDGGGDRGDWWQWPKETRDGARRPRTVHLAHCQQTVLSGITVRNSPSWTIHPYCCADLQVSAISVENPKDSPNTDGLNPESCARVDIMGVDFSVGDDCIAIKAGKRGPEGDAHLAPCEDITIRHCQMRFGHGAVVLGSEMSGDIRRVTIENCVFTQTDRGLRLKTRRGRGGTIADVTMRNVQMVGVPTPLAANAFYFCDADGKDQWVQSRAPAAIDETTPQIAGIRLENIVADDVTLAAAALLGLPEAPIADVFLSNFNVTYDPGAKRDVPLMALGVPAVRHGGVISEFADVTGQITVTGQEGAPEC